MSDQPDDVPLSLSALTLRLSHSFADAQLGCSSYATDV